MYKNVSEREEQTLDLELPGFLATSRTREEGWGKAVRSQKGPADVTREGTELQVQSDSPDIICHLTCVSPSQARHLGTHETAVLGTWQAE